MLPAAWRCGFLTKTKRVFSHHHRAAAWKRYPTLATRNLNRSSCHTMFLLQLGYDSGHSMECTQGTSAFQQQFPLMHALVSGDSAAVASLCTPQQAAKCGPGCLSVVMVALLLGADEHLPSLLAAKAPLDATLTPKYSDSELHRWLAAGQPLAQLTDRLEFRHLLMPGQTALHMASALGKLEQAKLLVTAGAGLEPLLYQHSDGCVAIKINTSTKLLREVRPYALSHYLGGRLAAAPAALLGQLARLAFESWQRDNCLVILQAAAQRGVQLSDTDAEVLLARAAFEGQVQVTMHVVQHSPHSIWGLLASANSRLAASSAAELFPYLAQQVQSFKLELPSDGSLERVIKNALQADQPAAALALLHAAQDQKTARRQEQQQEQPQKHRQQQQQQQGLSADSLSELLRVAASRGHTDVVQYLLQQDADVLPLCMDSRTPVRVNFGPSRLEPNIIIHSSVAPLVFSHIAQQYAEGSMPVLDSRQLEVVLLEAVRCSQPDACIRLLRTAAAWQGQTHTAAAASAALREAAGQGLPSVVMHVVAHHYGASLLWPLLDPWAETSSAVVHDVVLHIAGQVSARTLQLDSNKLSCLVYQAARNQAKEACQAILTAAGRQQLQLTAAERYSSLHACMRNGCPAELVSFLRAGTPLDSSQLRSLAFRAASADLGTVLEQLLQEGAVTNTALVRTTIEALACSCLAVLLRQGPLPVDTSKPILRGADCDDRCDYRCPVLHVMQRSKHDRYLDRRGLRMLEMLLAAGHRPRVYHDMVLPPATQPVAVFDPLKKRWLWLALEPEGWTPVSHHRHPSLLKDAFRTVLLAAAHGRRGSAAKVLEPAEAPCKRRRQIAAGGCASCPSSAACLSMLPPDLLLHVLHLAARPLSNWLAEQELHATPLEALYM